MKKLVFITMLILSISIAYSDTFNVGPNQNIDTIQEAIELARLNNEEDYIYVADGDYYGTIFINEDSINLIGNIDSPDQCKIFGNNSNNDVINVDNNGEYSFHITGFQISNCGNYNNNYGLEINEVYDLEINECIFNENRMAMKIQNCIYNTVLIYNNIAYCNGTEHDGIMEIIYTNNFTINGNEFVCSGIGNSTCVDVTRSSNGTISNNIFSNFPNDIWLHSGGESCNQNIYIQNNEFYDSNSYSSSVDKSTIYIIASDNIFIRNN